MLSLCGLYFSVLFHLIYGEMCCLCRLLAALFSFHIVFCMVHRLYNSYFTTLIFQNCQYEHAKQTNRSRSLCVYSLWHLIRFPQRSIVFTLNDVNNFDFQFPLFLCSFEARIKFVIHLMMTFCSNAQSNRITLQERKDEFQVYPEQYRINKLETCWCSWLTSNIWIKSWIQTLWQKLIKCEIKFWQNEGIFPNSILMQY